MATPRTMMPDWNEWANREHCKVWELVYIAHDIAARRANYELLKERHDERAKLLPTHMNSALKALRPGDGLLKPWAQEAKTLSNTDVYLRDGLRWVMQQGWPCIPPGLVDLAQRLPDSEPPAPDWSNWGKKPFYSLDEGVSLLMGVDPSVHSSDANKQRFKEFYKRYEHTLDTAKRLTAKAKGVAGREGDASQATSSGFLLQLAAQVDLVPPPRLLDAFRTQNDGISSAASSTQGERAYVRLNLLMGRVLLLLRDRLLFERNVLAGRGVSTKDKRLPEAVITGEELNISQLAEYLKPYALEADEPGFSASSVREKIAKALAAAEAVRSGKEPM